MKSFGERGDSCLGSRSQKMPLMALLDAGMYLSKGFCKWLGHNETRWLHPTAAPFRCLRVHPRPTSRFLDVCPTKWAVQFAPI